MLPLAEGIKKERAQIRENFFLTKNVACEALSDVTTQFNSFDSNLKNIS